MDYFNAFWFGGLICALIQILLDKTKLMPGRVMVLLVCSGAVLSAGAAGVSSALIFSYLASFFFRPKMKK